MRTPKRRRPSVALQGSPAAFLAVQRSSDEGSKLCARWNRLIEEAVAERRRDPSFNARMLRSRAFAAHNAIARSVTEKDKLAALRKYVPVMRDAIDSCRRVKPKEST